MVADQDTHPDANPSGGMTGRSNGYGTGMPGSESDVPADPRVASSRETGGRESAAEQRRAGDPDGEATTGTDENEEFVGRVAGQDAGYAGETGAEARRQRRPGESEGER